MNAREWLEKRTYGRKWGDHDRMRDALLAVLDECDELQRNEEQVRDLLGSGYHSGQMPVVARIRVAIDKALGVTDD